MLTMKQYNYFGFNEVDASENFLDPWWCGDVPYFDVLVDIIETQDKETCDYILKELQKKGHCTMYGEMEVDVMYSVQESNDPTDVDEYTGNTEFRLEIELEKIPTGKVIMYELTMTLVCDLVADTEYKKEIVDTLKQTVKTKKFYKETEMTAYLRKWFDNVAQLSE